MFSRRVCLDPDSQDSTRALLITWAGLLPKMNILNQSRVLDKLMQYFAIGEQALIKN